jgi:hypothetical protein
MSPGQSTSAAELARCHVVEPKQRSGVTVNG